MKEKIKLKIFVHPDNSELKSMLTATTSAITSIEVQFINFTKHKITLSLNEVFKKMVDYIILLLYNITS